jgi:hypothetical protein
MKSKKLASRDDEGFHIRKIMMDPHLLIGENLGLSLGADCENLYVYQNREGHVALTPGPVIRLKKVVKIETAEGSLKIRIETSRTGNESTRVDVETRGLRDHTRLLLALQQNCHGKLLIRDL